MRTGIIKTFDASNRSGLIIDENDQEIPFYAGADGNELKTAKKVNFEIELTSRGLVAVQVSVSC